MAEERNILSIEPGCFCLSSGNLEHPRREGQITACLSNLVRNEKLLRAIKQGSETDVARNRLQRREGPRSTVKSSPLASGSLNPDTAPCCHVTWGNDSTSCAYCHICETSAQLWQMPWRLITNWPPRTVPVPSCAQWAFPAERGAVQG